MKSRFNILYLFLAICLLFSFNHVGQAANPWDSAAKQKLTFIVPYGAGGSTDATVRLLAKSLNKLGLNVTAVNKPGASGTEGTYFASQQSPESGVILATSPTAFHFLPAREKVGYSWKDFEPIATFSAAAFAFAVKADSKYKNMKQLIDDAKANPGKISIGSTGTGTEYQFLIEQIFDKARAKITYVAFKGGGDISTALLGGHIDVDYGSVAGLAQLVKGDKVRFLAHTFMVSETLKAFPDVPHVRSLGYDFVGNSDYSLWAPKGTSVELRKALEAAVKEATKDPEMIAGNEKLGLAVSFMGIEDTYKYAKSLGDEIIPQYLQWAEKQKKQSK